MGAKPTTRRTPVNAITVSGRPDSVEKVIARYTGDPITVQLAKEGADAVVAQADGWADGLSREVLRATAGVQRAIGTVGEVIRLTSIRD